MFTAALPTALGVVNSTGSMPLPTISHTIRKIASEITRIARLRIVRRRRRADGACHPPRRARPLRSRRVQLTPDVKAQLREPRIGAHGIDLARPAERHIQNFP